MGLDEDTLSSILDFLEKSTVRERTKGAEKLKSVLNENPDDIPVRYFQDFLKTLIDFFEYENVKRQKLLKKLTDIDGNVEESKTLKSMDEKTIEAAFLARLFVEKTSHRFTGKHLNFFLSVLLNIVHSEEITFSGRPVSNSSGSSASNISKHEIKHLPLGVLTNISFAVARLVKNPTFHLKKSNELWSQTLETGLYSLNALMNDGITVAPDVQNWLNVLNELLKQDTIDIKSFSKGIVNTVYRFVSSVTRETSNCAKTIELVNKTLLRTHLSNINCLKLIKPTVTLISKTQYLRNKDLCLEVAYFNVFISKLLPFSKSLSNTSSMFVDWYLELTNHLKTTLNLFQEKKFDFKVQFKPLGCFNTTFKWTSFADFQLADIQAMSGVDYASKWLLLYSVVRLLEVYYARHEQELLQKSNSVITTRQTELGIFSEDKVATKKPKYTYDLLTECFSNSASMSEFIMNCLIEGSMEENRVFGLQVFAFCCARHDLDFDHSMLLKRVIPLMGNDLFYQWCCLAIITLVSFEQYEMSTNDFENILKLTLPKLAKTKNFDITCVTITRLVTFQPKQLQDNTLLYRIYDTIDAFVINGPVNVTEYSLDLWKSLYYLAPAYKSSTRETSIDKFYQWLDYKWLSFVRSASIDTLIGLSNFVLWLCNKKESVPQISFNEERFETLYYSDWEYLDAERAFLYWPINLPNKKFRKTVQISYDGLNKTVVRLVNEKLNDSLSDIQDIPEFLQKAALWVGSLHLVNSLSSDSRYLPEVASLTDLLAMALKHIKFESYEHLILFVTMLRRIDLSALPQSLAFELRRLNFKKVYLTSIKAAASVQEGDFLDNFTQPKRGALTVTDVTTSCSTHVTHLLERQFYTEDVEKILFVEVTLTALLDNTSESLMSCLDFLSSLDTEIIFAAGKFFLAFFEKGNIQDCDEGVMKILKGMAELLLTTAYNTSNQSIETLSELLIVTMPVWLELGNNEYMEDARTIFSWLEKCFDKVAFNGSFATFSFYKLVIKLLQKSKMLKPLQVPKNALFEQLLLCLSSMPIYFSSKCMKDLGKYMLSMNESSKNHFVTKMSQSLNVDTLGFSNKAMFLYCITEFSSVSQTNLLKFINSITSYTHDVSLCSYVEKSLNLLTSSFGFTSTMQILEMCKFTVLEKWYLDAVQNLDSDHLPLDIKCFGVQSLEMFFTQFQIEIIAFHFAHQIQSALIMDTIQKVTSKKAVELVRASIPLIFALAYSDIGSGSETIRSAEKVVGSGFLFSNKIPIAYSILTFCACGDLSYTRNQLAECFPNSFLKDVIMAGNHLKFYNGLNIQILHIKVIFSKHKIFSSFTQNEVNLLILKIISNLDKVSTEEEEIQTIRILKMALILFEDLIHGDAFIQYVETQVCRLMQKQSTHDEVAYLLVGLCEIHNVSEKTTGAFFSAVFESLLNYRRTNSSEINKPLLDALEVSLQNCEQVHVFWNTALQYLSYQSYSASYTHDVSTLFACDEHDAVFHINFLSALFAIFPEPVFDEVSGNLSILVVDALRGVEVPLPSKNFLLWKTFYLSSHFEQTLQISMPKIKHAKHKEMLDSFGLLTQLFPLICRNVSNTTAAAVRFASECALGAFYGKPLEEVSLFQLSKVDYKAWKQDILPIDVDSFFMMNKPCDIECGLQGFSTSYFRDPAISYKKWLTLFWCSFVSELAHIDMVLVFASLATVDFCFVEDSFVDFFLFSLYFSNTKGVFTNILSSIDVLTECKESEKKISKLLEIIEVIRAASYYSSSKEQTKLVQKHLLEVYKSLPKLLLFETSLEIQNLHFAFLILDETYQSFQDYEGNIQDIQKLFLNFQDEDLVSCIPKAPSLLTSLELLNFSHAQGLKRFIFNSSAIDTGYLNMGGESFYNSFVESSVQNRFSSVSKLFLDNSANAAYYDWYDNLDDWDLPDVGTYQTRAQIMHAFIQGFRNGQSSDENNVQQIVSKFSTSGLGNTFLIDTIPDLLNMPKLLDFDSSSYASFSNFLLKKDKFMLESIGWSNYEVSLRARIKFLSYSYLSNMKNQENIGLAKAAELASYNKRCLQFKDGQLALKSAMELDQFVSTEMRNHSKFIDLKLLSDVCSAATLWYQGESIAPVQILKRVLSVSGANTQNFEKVRPSESYISSLLVEYLSKSRQMLPMKIYQSYVLPYKANLELLSSFEERSKIYYTLGEFFYKHAKTLLTNSDLKFKQKQFRKYQQELKDLELLYYNSKSQSEKKDASKYFKIMQDQLAQEKQALKDYDNEKRLFVYHCLEHFAKAMKFSSSARSDILDKFCALWFQVSDEENINEQMLGIISEVETFKLLPWINQMVSKLSGTQTMFQRTLSRTIKRIVFNFPYESIYHLLNAKLYGNSRSEGFESRLQAIDSILTSLSRKGDFEKRYLIPITDFVKNCVELACKNLEPNVKFFDLTTHTVGSFWTSILPEYDLPLPTVCVSIISSDDGVKKERPRILRVMPKVNISPSGISRPKIMEFLLSDGSKKKILIKGNDDLRQDAIMQQVFKQVNLIFSSHQHSRKKKLRVRTYEVIPMGNKAGIIEFIENASSLRDVLVPLHKRDGCSLSAARETMKRMLDKSKEEKVAVYTKMTSQIKPVFRSYFFQRYTNPEKWLETRYMYTKSLVTTSVVGHILGIGDRHLQNIMVDEESAELVHIDFGIAFDRGKTLTIPELVPFRLTRDMVDGLGIAGVEGLFRKNFEYAYKLLREEQEKVMSVLNILRWDPLYSWSISPLKKARLQALRDADNQQATDMAAKGSEKVKSSKVIAEEVDEETNDKSVIALSGVEKKLKGLSVEATVQELITEATSVENLGVIFYGWSPFY
ncbi:hypothetical protein ACO0RG_004419 [Hanseniaspora osmophila]